ncbi:hypothetical protein NF27_DP01640 [Candidatus Jidaibacter acanthamoeba]|uniref:DUF2460 domain-containing protein n=1 Tax=Candidatus Jidaibacter acanthamoebae TaxID=86105 RepID=A0A0C1R000_9RICK|nr:DUF2460 domain-containing protein [Candidatus Jidaibacter acanthamoeba]KIE05620.1 hypothetical protein NF27_DP01640 [Candidatus Jidaibacter acanthamoeba]
MKEKKIKFIEQRFPENISYGSSGGPCYSTDVITMTSGYEQRNINWQQSRNQYNVAYGIKTEEHIKELIAFFRICKGKAIGFRFKDWNDYTAKNQLIAIGDGKKNSFQLVKTYKTVAVKEQRIISKPVPGKVKIFLDDNEYKEVEVDYTSGIVTFKTPPAADVKITASFNFDVPVRFDTDSLLTSIEAYQTHSLNNIPLVEIRV